MDLQNEPSTFAKMVDELRTKSETELKLLYIKFFSKDLKTEWAEFTADADFKNTSEEDIIKAIQKKRL